jgi:hypothetical protein
MLPRFSIWSYAKQATRFLAIAWNFPFGLILKVFGSFGIAAQAVQTVELFIYIQYFSQQNCHFVDIVWNDLYDLSYFHIERVP